MFGVNRPHVSLCRWLHRWPSFQPLRRSAACITLTLIFVRFETPQRSNHTQHSMTLAPPPPTARHVSQSHPECPSPPQADSLRCKPQSTKYVASCMHPNVVPTLCLTCSDFARRWQIHPLASLPYYTSVVGRAVGRRAQHKRLTSVQHALHRLYSCLLLSVHRSQLLAARGHPRSRQAFNSTRSSVRH
jgi:hypothetical protein